GGGFEKRPRHFVIIRLSCEAYGISENKQQGFVQSGSAGMLSIEQEELRGISRTVAEIEWLLLILVLLYQFFEGPAPDDRVAISMVLFFYAAFILSFRYANFYKTETRWKIAIETFAMLLFSTWVLWFTGKLASPLVNTYLLVIITSA